LKIANKSPIVNPRLIEDCAIQLWQWTIGAMAHWINAAFSN
jgi:hypothetical protein